MTPCTDSGGNCTGFCTASFAKSHGSAGFVGVIESHPIRLGMRKPKSIASSPRLELERYEFVYDCDFAHLFAVLLDHAQCDFDAA